MGTTTPAGDVPSASGLGRSLQVDEADNPTELQPALDCSDRVPTSPRWTDPTAHEADKLPELRPASDCSDPFQVSPVSSGRGGGPEPVRERSPLEGTVTLTEGIKWMPDGGRWDSMSATHTWDSIADDQLMPDDARQTFAQMQSRIRQHIMDGSPTAHCSIKRMKFSVTYAAELEHSDSD